MDYKKNISVLGFPKEKFNKEQMDKLSQSQRYLYGLSQITNGVEVMQVDEFTAMLNDTTVRGVDTYWWYIENDLFVSK